MTFPRRALSVLCGLALAVTLFGAGPPSSPPAAGEEITVELTLADGSKVTGILFQPPTIRLQSHYGVIDFRPDQVKRITPQSTGETVLASVELTDHNLFTGTLQTEAIVIRDGDTVKRYQPSGLQQILFKQKQDTSLLGIILGLLTLTLMEIVLGVDNIIFLAIVAGKLPKEKQPMARRIGLFAALGTRLLLLATLSFLLGLTRPIFTLPELPLLHSPEARGISWRDVILLVGGMFLIGKSVFEMHEKLETAKAEKAGHTPLAKATSFVRVIVQIAIIDIIFSLDSVITAVGMVEQLWVMITAMLIAVGVMMLAAEPIARFVDQRPTVKILALSFLILIGVLLVAEGLGQHMNKGYIYFAMAFAVGVELVNMQLRGSATPTAAAPEAPTTA